MTKPLPTELETLLEQLEDAWVRKHGSPPVRRDEARLRLRPTPRARVRGAAAVAIAAAAAAVLLTRTSGPGAVAKAVAAAGEAPAGTIVHFLSVSTETNGRVSGRTELWAATDPPYAQRSILQGENGTAIEQGARGDELMQYDPADGVVYIRTGAGGIAAGNHPADFAPSAEEIKRYLQVNSTVDDGTVAVGGERVHRFTISPPQGGRCVYDVDANTFEARDFTCSGLPSGDIREHWDYLPRAGNESLLSVAAQHPDAHRDVGMLESCGPGTHTAATPPCVVNAVGG